MHFFKGFYVTRDAHCIETVREFGFTTCLVSETLPPSPTFIALYCSHPLFIESNPFIAYVETTVV